MNARTLIENDLKAEMLYGSADIVSVVFVHRRSNMFVTSNMTLCDDVQDAVKFETTDEAVEWANASLPRWEDKWTRANIAWTPR